MNRLTIFVLVAAAAVALLCLVEAKPFNPFKILSDYRGHVDSKLQKYKETFRKNIHSSALQGARHAQRHFAVLSDLDTTFENATDITFSEDTNLTDVSAACFAVWSTYVLPNMADMDQCATQFSSFFVNPALEQADLADYCEQTNASSCYNLFDNFINQLYAECSSNDLDNLDLGGFDFSQLTALRLPCFQDGNDTCYADAIRMIHTLLANPLPQNPTEISNLLDGFCTPCVQSLLWEFSQTAGDDDSYKVSFYLLNNMCLQDNGTYCLVTLEQLHQITTNYAVDYEVRTIQSLELVCGNNCYDMFISGLASAYESSGGVDENGDNVNVDSLDDKNFNFCDRSADGALCVVKIMNFIQTAGNASESCPFGDDSSGSYYSDSFPTPDPMPSVPVEPIPPVDPSVPVDPVPNPPSSASGGTGFDSSTYYSGGDGLDPSYELPSGAGFDDFADDFNGTDAVCTAECKQFFAAFVQNAGCCIGSFLRYVSPEDDFVSSAPYTFFENSCGNDIPDPCSAEGLIEGTLTFENLNIAYVNAHLEDFRLYVRLDLAFSLSIDKNDIKITSVNSFNSYNHYLMAGGVTVSYSIVTPDIEVRDRVSGDLKAKIQAGNLALANVNNLPVSARIDSTKSIGVTAASASSVTTGTRPLNSRRSGATAVTAFSVATAILLLVNLLFLA